MNEGRGNLSKPRPHARCHCYCHCQKHLFPQGCLSPLSSEIAHCFSESFNPLMPLLTCSPAAFPQKPPVWKQLSCLLPSEAQHPLAPSLPAPQHQDGAGLGATTDPCLHPDTGMEPCSAPLLILHAACHCCRAQHLLQLSKAAELPSSV